MRMLLTALVLACPTSLATGQDAQRTSVKASVGDVHFELPLVLNGTTFVLTDGEELHAFSNPRVRARSEVQWAKALANKTELELSSFTYTFYTVDDCLGPKPFHVACRSPEFGNGPDLAYVEVRTTDVSNYGTQLQNPPASENTAGNFADLPGRRRLYYFEDADGMYTTPCNFVDYGIPLYDCTLARLLQPGIGYRMRFRIPAGQASSEVVLGMTQLGRDVISSTIDAPE